MRSSSDQRRDFGERRGQRPVEQPRRCVGILMRAAERLGHDAVDDAALEQIVRGDLQRFGRFDLAARVAPEDRRAAFRRDHAVDRELLHQHLVADREAERAAAAAFAGDDDDDRDADDGHLAQVERDGLGDAALFRFDAGIRRRRVDEDEDRAG